MEWFTHKAYEMACAFSGGFLAAKNLEGLPFRQLWVYMMIAVMLGFSSRDLLVQLVLDYKTLHPAAMAWLTIEAINAARVLLLILLSACSFRLLDVVYGLIARLKTIRLPWGAK